MSPITTHVLDTSTGKPASGVPITLSRKENDHWNIVGSGSTDNDGRLKTLMAEGTLLAGTYRIVFECSTYFENNSVSDYFYPSAQIDFIVKNTEQHYHVPLLLNPFGYSTYRGS